MSFQQSFVDLCLPVGTEALKRGSRIKNPKYSKAHTGLYKPIDSTFVDGDTYPRSWLSSQPYMFATPRPVSPSHYIKNAFAGR